MTPVAAPSKEIKTFTFSIENQDKAEKIIARYPAGHQNSAVIPLLDLAQRQCGGWLPRPAILYVADLLRMPELHVYEIASFYTMFNLEPIGKFHIQVCRTTPCWLAGGAAITEACCKKLGIGVGETTSDGYFTISEVECLGNCSNGPVLHINDKVYENLTPQGIETLLDDLAVGRKSAVATGKKE